MRALFRVNRLSIFYSQIWIHMSINFAMSKQKTTTKFKKQILSDESLLGSAFPMTSTIHVLTRFIIICRTAIYILIVRARQLLTRTARWRWHTTHPTVFIALLAHWFWSFGVIVCNFFYINFNFVIKQQLSKNEGNAMRKI